MKYMIEVNHTLPIAESLKVTSRKLYFLSYCSHLTSYNSMESIPIVWDD